MAPSNRVRSPAARTPDERHQREADHQRGRGRGGAGRVAHRVAARELPGRAADPRRGPAEHDRERRDEPRREHRDAEEDARPPRRRRTAGAGPVERPVTSRPTSISATAPSDRRERGRLPEARKARRREHRSLARPRRSVALGWSGSPAAARASSVITTPTTSETTTVRVANTVPVCGRSIPNDTSRRSAPSRARAPGTAPRPRPAAPITNASSITERQHLAAGRAERPQRRELARALGDRDRQRVRDHEAARRTARSRRMRAGSPGRSSRKPLVSLVACAAWPCPVLTCAVGGSSGRIVATICCGETPCLAAMLIWSNSPCLSNSRCAVGSVNIASVAPPSEETPPNLTDADDREPLLGTARDDVRSCCPMARCCLLAVFGVDRRSGPAPPASGRLTGLSGLKRWPPRAWS